MASSKLDAFLEHPAYFVDQHKAKTTLVPKKVPLDQTVNGHQVSVRETTRQRDLTPSVASATAPFRSFEVKLDGKSLAPVTLYVDGRFRSPAFPYQTFPSIAALVRKSLDA